MKRFRFRLARVQRVRAIETDVAAGALQEILAQVAEAEHRRALLASTIDAMRAKWRAQLEGDGPLSPSELLLLETEIERLRTTERTQAGRVKQLRTQADERQAAWAACRTSERALEVLEERRHEEHRLAARREETQELDETASQRSRNRFQPGRVLDR